MSENLPTQTDAILAAEINEAHALAMQHAGEAVAQGIRVGHLLLEAKAKIPHGQWLPWLRANVTFSDRTAQSYMRIAHKSPPEIRNGAADLSLRKAIQHVAGPRRRSIDDDLQALIERCDELRRHRSDPMTIEDVRALADWFRDFDRVFHRHGLCEGQWGLCTICGDEWLLQNPEEALRLFGEEEGM
jgi:hypothetical protein